MPLFIVEVQEIHLSTRLVEADNAEEAADKVGDNGVELNLEYDSTAEVGEPTEVTEEEAIEDHDATKEQIEKARS